MKKTHTRSGTERADPTTRQRAFQAAAFRHVTEWLSASREYMERKFDRWKLLEDLYHNRRDLNSWGVRPTGALTRQFDTTGSSTAGRPDRWQSDIVLAPSYIVDTWADRAYQAIFSGPEWLTVVPEAGAPRDDGSSGAFPLSGKLQELLLAKLSQGQIHVRIYEILQHLVLYGTVYAKIFWYSKGIMRRRWNYETLDVVKERGTIYDCPIIQVIPLDRVLPDWTADHGDVQRFDGIGHLVDKPYDHVLEQFSRKVYHLNRKAFVNRWADAGAQGPQEGLSRDPDALPPDREAALRFTIWEWHGRVPFQGRRVECVCAIVTEQGARTPDNGIMVRLTPGPVLWSGLRPFLCAQYTPLPGPLGMGAVESNLDLIHAISQFISQSQDNTRLTANAQLIIRRGSSAARQISTENETVYPGKIWTVDDPDDVRPFPPLNFPQHDVNHLIDYLYSLLERRTNVSEITLGVSSRDKTATEAHILQESAQSPFATRTDLFARCFLETMGRIVLAMLRQFLLEDQTITVRDAHGKDVSITIAPEDLQEGCYRVAATLTRQDSTRLAKAQSIERALPTLTRFKPLLDAEGIRISFGELIKRYLDLIGIEGADRVFQRISGDPETGDDGAGGERFGQNQDSHAMYWMPPRRGETAAEPPGPLVEDGGPMGRFPSDANALAQFLGRQAQQI